MSHRLRRFLLALRNLEGRMACTCSVYAVYPSMCSRCKDKILDRYRTNQNELMAAAEQKACEIYSKKKTDEKLLNFPIGKEVIIRSNEDEPLLRGVVIDHEQMGGGDPTPVIRTKDGTTIYAMGAISYYSKERWDALSKLTPKEQWLVMTRYT